MTEPRARFIMWSACLLSACGLFAYWPVLSADSKAAAQTTNVMQTYLVSVTREKDAKGIVSYVSVFKANQPDDVANYNLTTMRGTDKAILFARCVEYMAATCPIQPNDSERYYREWKFLFDQFEKLKD